MATTSFKKEFVVNDRDTADRLRKDPVDSSATVSYTKKDSQESREKGEKLLKRLALA